MEHPGLSVRTIKEDMTIEQVQTKINDLMSRLSFSYGMGQQELVYQIEMALETYQRAHHEMIDEMFKGNKGMDGKIDIS